MENKTNELEKKIEDSTSNEFSLKEKIKIGIFSIALATFISFAGYDMIKTDIEQTKINDRYNKSGRLVEEGYNKSEIDSIFSQNRKYIGIFNKKEWFEYWSKKGEKVNEEMWNRNINNWREFIKTAFNSNLYLDNHEKYYIIPDELDKDK